MIDSCHRDRLMESHSELAKLLTEKELRDALLLIFANKQVRERDLKMILTSLWEREMYKYAHNIDSIQKELIQMISQVNYKDTILLMDIWFTCY